MSKARDISNLFSSSTDVSTDAEVNSAIASHAASTTNRHYKAGNTSSRPGSPNVGDIYTNTETGFIEIYESTGWTQVGAIASAPTGVTATNQGSGRAYNNGQSSVAFTAGSVAGKTYTVTSSPGSYTATGSSSPLTVTGLQSNTAYTYTVTATNNYGTSSASSASSAVTATTVPQAPTIGTATGGNAQASVTFTAGATGGSAITSYTVISSPGGFTGSGASSPINVTGLTNGTAYTFTVNATNTNGVSAASSASNSVTPTSAPTITTATAMPAARAFGNTPSNSYHSGRYWYVGGATVTNPDTNANNNVYSFNGTSWTTEANYPFSYNSPSAVSDGTNLYVIGGSPVSGGSTEVRYISGTGGSWSAGTSLPAAAHRQACVYYSGKIHALSGDNNSGSGTLRHYRLDSGSWTTLSDTPGTAGLIPSAAIYNSKIYRYSYDTFYSYNGTSWTAEPAPPATNRYSVALLTIGSKIYAIGGNTGLWANTAVNTIYSFNGTAWTTEPVTLPVEKGWHSGGTDGAVGYVYGGINNSSSVVATNYKITT